MSKIKDILTQVEIRVALAQGLDVQIHAEDRLIQTIRHKYELLFDQYWWDQYLVSEKFTLDPLTGTPTNDLSLKIKRFQDIHSVFLNKDTRPLPYANKGVNPESQRIPGLLSIPNPVKVFKIVPLPKDGDYVNVWYRTMLSPSVWADGAYETEVPMDDQMLILGSCYDFLVDDGTNDVAAEKFKSMFDMRVAQQAAFMHQHKMTKSIDSSVIPSGWYETNAP